MNTKLIFTSVLALTIAGAAFAQEQPPRPEQERPLNEDTAAPKELRLPPNEKVTVIVDGEKIIVNGKPLDYRNDKNVRVFRGQPGPDGYTFSDPRLKGVFTDPQSWSYNKAPFNKAVLGVITEKNDKGAKINDITKESGAEKAGLKKDDIITKVNDTKIPDPESLYQAIGKFKPEEKVKITYLRNGKEATTSAVLTKANIRDIEVNNDVFNFPFPQVQFDDQFANQFRFIGSKPRLGIQIQDLEEGSGVKVTGIDENSPAAKSGLKKDDIITEINGTEVKDVDDLRGKIKDLKEGDTYKVKYKRDGKSESIDIKIPKKLKTANL